MWTTPSKKNKINISQEGKWGKRFKPPKLCSWPGQDPQWNVETPFTRRIRLSPCSIQQKMAARTLPWKMARIHNNTNINTWKRPYEPFKLSSICSNNCSMKSNGESDQCKIVGHFWSERNTVNTIMWRQSQTGNYRPSFVSRSHSKEGPSEQWASRIHLLRYKKAI